MSAIHSIRKPGSIPQAQTLETVEVFAISLDVPEPVRARRERILSHDERERASRFRFDRDRRRFIACRGAVRALIGSRTGADPSSIEFRYGPRGKPELGGTLAGALAFNVSHSEEIALCAIAAQGPIGVDGERVRDFPDLDAIADRFFTPGERAFIDEVPVWAHRVDRFFHLWTMKEAWLKAEGEGLAGPLTEVEITLGPDGLPRLCARHAGLSSDLGWRLVSFRPVPEWIGAVATRATARIVLRPWDG